MRKIFALVIGFGLMSSAVWADNEPQSYAAEKLINAEAQLEKLRTQQKAINDLMRAVKQDHKAAKIRAKAEKIQIKADAARNEASQQIEQVGVAIELPSLLLDTTTKTNTAAAKDIDLMFKDTNKTESVFFPGYKKTNEKGINNDSYTK